MNLRTAGAGADLQLLSDSGTVGLGPCEFSRLLAQWPTCCAIAVYCLFLCSCSCTFRLSDVMHLLIFNTYLFSEASGISSGLLINMMDCYLYMNIDSLQI